ncbi:MAG TPA: hypothetical protein VGP82_08330 [Ktedonobacterales bacterium]|nr:hypothetical protein [Ktedonobacterales bacterium]
MLLGCGCLFALLAASFPRVALLFLWVFTPLVDRAFATFVGPLLGLAFLPFTTIMYVFVWPVFGWGWLWVGLGLLLDISTYAGGAYRNRAQIQRYPAGPYYGQP